jgi:hypothetical protein
MESSNTVPRLELVNVLANGMDDPGYVIASVVRFALAEYFWCFPEDRKQLTAVCLAWEGTYQSLGFVPLTITLMTTWSGPGLGIGESTIATSDAPATIASFMIMK